MLIYKITNNINNKVYIGQTTYDSLLERIDQYKKEYKYRPNSRPIIKAMVKYGWENFSWEILTTTNNKEELDKLERYYIAQYHSLCSENGYNIELGGSGPGTHSEDTKRKISEAQLGEKNHMFGKTGYKNITSKEIIELTTGLIFGSALEASRYFNLSNSHISAVARGERGSTGGRVFRYLDDKHQIIQPEYCAKIKKLKYPILSKYKLYVI
jgi:hypothetical protein